MKTGRFLLIGCGVAALSAMLALSAMAESDEQVVPLDQVPAVVQATINQHVAGGQVVKIEVETKDGTTVYEVKGTQGSEKVEFLVKADGTYVEKAKEEADEENEKEGKEGEGKGGEEVVASVTDLPAAVQAEVAKIVGANSIGKITKETEDGELQYEVEYAVAGMQNSVNLTQDGEILELESGVEPSALPKAVAEELQEEFPNAKIDSATSVQKFGYEVEIVGKDGKKQEVKISPSGEIEKEHKGKNWKHEEKEEGESHGKKANKESKEKAGKEDDD